MQICKKAFLAALFPFDTTIWPDTYPLFPSGGIHFLLIWLFVCRRSPYFSLGRHTLSAYLAFCMPTLPFFFPRPAYTFRLFGFLYADVSPLFLSGGIHFPLIWLFVCRRSPSFSLTWHTLSAYLAFCMPSLALFFSHMAYTFRLFGFLYAVARPLFLSDGIHFPLILLIVCHSFSLRFVELHILPAI